MFVFLDLKLSRASSISKSTYSTAYSTSTILLLLVGVGVSSAFSSCLSSSACTALASNRPAAVRVQSVPLLDQLDYLRSWYFGLPGQHKKPTPREHNLPSMDGWMIVAALRGKRQGSQTYNSEPTDRLVRYGTCAHRSTYGTVLEGMVQQYL